MEHIFGEDENGLELKEIFSLQSDKLKISTIESFKGLEIKAVIYLTSRLDDIKIDIETYIAFTRATSCLIAKLCIKRTRMCL